MRFIASKIFRISCAFVRGSPGGTKYHRQGCQPLIENVNTKQNPDGVICFRIPPAPSRILLRLFHRYVYACQNQPCAYECQRCHHLAKHNGAHHHS